MLATAACDCVSEDVVLLLPLRVPPLLLHRSSWGASAGFDRVQNLWGTFSKAVVAFVGASVHLERIRGHLGTGARMH